MIDEVRLWNTARSQGDLQANMNTTLSGNEADLPASNSAWKMVIGHELVVPVINANNPYFNEISKKGFTTDDFHSVCVFVWYKGTKRFDIS